MNTSNAGVLAVDDLHLSYADNAILKGVSLTLDQGEVVSLLGPSGSGKTTLLRAVAGFEAPLRGTITVSGRAVFDAGHGIEIPAEDRNLGLVFQSYALWPHKTVFENVAYGLRLRRVAEPQMRVRHALAELSLEHLADRYPHQLSGGQQQRVAIARALVYDPPVILMDEPLSNLDAKLREEARAWLRGLIAEKRLSALVVTHDQSEAMAMSDRILLLNNGVIEQQGTPREMYYEPKTVFTAGFMGSSNRLEGRIEEARGGDAMLVGKGFTLWGRARPSAEPGKAGVGMIRLEHVRITQGPDGNRVRARLTTSMFLGDRWEHIFRHEALMLRAHAPAAIAPGEHWVELPRDRLWIF